MLTRLRPNELRNYPQSREYGAPQKCGATYYTVSVTTHILADCPDTVVVVSLP